MNLRWPSFVGVDGVCYLIALNDGYLSTICKTNDVHHRYSPSNVRHAAVIHHYSPLFGQSLRQTCNRYSPLFTANRPVTPSDMQPLFTTGSVTPSDMQPLFSAIHHFTRYSPAILPLFSRYSPAILPLFTTPPGE